jgi:hypothetical protein
MIKGHQGDVQFRQLKSLPKGAIEVNNKPLAYGEHSKHQHILTGDFKMYEVKGTIFAVVGERTARLQHVHESIITEEKLKSPAELQKADHGSHVLNPGVYEFWIQNQYNPYSGLMEAARD